MLPDANLIEDTKVQFHEISATLSLGDINLGANVIEIQSSYIRIVTTPCRNLKPPPLWTSSTI